MENEIKEDIGKDIFEEDAGIEEQNYYREGQVKEGIVLPLGLALNDTELYQLSAKKKINLICIMGPAGSGKTTFMAMLYSMFLRQSNNNLLFSGSDTIAGFEELLNYIRVSSGKTNVELPRTPKDRKERYYHLKLYINSTKKKSNIILSDIPGETFNACKANKDRLDSEVRCLALAKRIVIFIDGKAVLKNAEWNAAIMDTRQLIMTIRSSEQFRAGTNIDVVISKNDEIVGINSNEKVKRRLMQIENNFQQYYKDCKIRFFRIQALNDYQHLDEGSTSLLDLLTFWVDESSNEQKEVKNQYGELQVISQFNRFMER